MHWSILKYSVDTVFNIKQYFIYTFMFLYIEYQKGGKSLKVGIRKYYHK